jgi:hypothetical protein
MTSLKFRDRTGGCAARRAIRRPAAAGALRERERPVPDLGGSDSMVQQAEDRACGEWVVLPDFPLLVRCVVELEVGQV